MATKAEQIVDHFVSDPALKAKIHEQIRKAREEGVSLDDIISEFTDDAGTRSKIKEIAGKVAAGHSIDHITGYHHADPAKAQSAAKNVRRHRETVKNIMKS